MLHVGGPANFRSVFGDDSPFLLVLCGHHTARPCASSRTTRATPSTRSWPTIRTGVSQAGLDAGQPMNPYMRAPAAIGDGWLRLLEFDPASAEPVIFVRTYSTRYHQLSSELATYTDGYREHEQPEMTDEEFHAAEEFALPLTGFRERFGGPGGG